MREWVQSAACLGRDELMFDPTQTDVALDMCLRACPVLNECVTDSAQWIGGLNTGVLAGVNRGINSRGNPRALKLVPRDCPWCERRFMVEPGSTKRYCTGRCREATRRATERGDDLDLTDIKFMSRIIDNILEEAL